MLLSAPQAAHEEERSTSELTITSNLFTSLCPYHLIIEKLYHDFVKLLYADAQSWPTAYAGATVTENKRRRKIQKFQERIETLRQSAERRGVSSKSNEHDSGNNSVCEKLKNWALGEEKVKTDRYILLCIKSFCEHYEQLTTLLAEKETEVQLLHTQFSEMVKEFQTQAKVSFQDQMQALDQAMQTKRERQASAKQKQLQEWGRHYHSLTRKLWLWVNQFSQYQETVIDILGKSIPSKLFQPILSSQAELQRLQQVMSEHSDTLEAPPVGLLSKIEKEVVTWNRCQQEFVQILSAKVQSIAQEHEKTKKELIQLQSNYKQLTVQLRMLQNESESLQLRIIQIGNLQASAENVKANMKIQTTIRKIQPLIEQLETKMEHVKLHLKTLMKRDKMIRDGVPSFNHLLPLRQVEKNLCDQWGSIHAHFDQEFQRFLTEHQMETKKLQEISRAQQQHDLTMMHSDRQKIEAECWKPVEITIRQVKPLLNVPLKQLLQSRDQFPNYNVLFDMLQRALPAIDYEYVNRRTKEATRHLQQLASTLSS